MGEANIREEVRKMVERKMKELDEIKGELKNIEDMVLPRAVDVLELVNVVESLRELVKERDDLVALSMMLDRVMLWVRTTTRILAFLTDKITKLEDKVEDIEEDLSKWLLKDRF